MSVLAAELGDRAPAAPARQHQHDRCRLTIEHGSRRYDAMSDQYVSALEDGQGLGACTASSAQVHRRTPRTDGCRLR
jgi:hypothetical protein